MMYRKSATECHLSPLVILLSGYTSVAGSVLILSTNVASHCFLLWSDFLTLYMHISDIVEHDSSSKQHGNFKVKRS